jgi:hypothetical protein
VRSLSSSLQVVVTLLAPALAQDAPPVPLGLELTGRAPGARGRADVAGDASTLRVEAERGGFARGEGGDWRLVAEKLRVRLRGLLRRG